MYHAQKWFKHNTISIVVVIMSHHQWFIILRRWRVGLISPPVAPDPQETVSLASTQGPALQHTLVHLNKTYTGTIVSKVLKWTMSRDFLLQFFLGIIFAQAPENYIRVISIFSKNSRRYSQVKVHHRYQRQQQQIFRQCHYTCGKLATGINEMANFPTSTACVVTNLLPVSTGPMATIWNNIRISP